MGIDLIAIGLALVAGFCFGNVFQIWLRSRLKHSAGKGGGGVPPL